MLGGIGRAARFAAASSLACGAPRCLVKWSGMATRTTRQAPSGRAAAAGPAGDGDRARPADPGERRLFLIDGPSLVYRAFFALPESIATSTGEPGTMTAVADEFDACIAELPAVKAAYEKFRERGFEVVAISLDDKESALRRFIKEKGLPWPQHFDGKGWENKFALQYGVFSIPTMWLVDKCGNLRATDVRFDLEQRIKSLLDEQESPAPNDPARS